MAEAQYFELLKKKRKSFRTAVTKIVNELEAELSNSDLNVDMVSKLVETLSIKFEPLTLVDQQLEPLFKLEEFDGEITEEYREKVLLWQFRAKKINEFSKPHVTSPSLLTTLSQSQDEHFRNSDNIRIKVPKYYITRFYGGDTSKWLTFWNSFETAVHNNESLNKVDKFNYLKAHLGGSALNTVEGFPISAKAYDEAVELLRNRFANPEILIQAHMNKILSLQTLKNSTDLRSFRKFVDNCNVQLRSLNSLGVSSANYEKILCPMLLKLIPYDLVLDSLGIKDPSEKRSKIELQDLALKHFENTVLRDDEGRYIVSIPWIEGSGKLEDHYSLAKGRLEKTVKTLKFTGRLFDYEQWEGGNPEKAVIYRHRRVVFGVSGSLFLFATELRPCFKQAPEHLEKVAEKLKDLMYVDNCVESFDSSEELKSFQRDSTGLFSLDKFDLRGWRHSVIEPNFDFRDNRQESDPLEIQIMWNVKEDTFSISYRETNMERKFERWKKQPQEIKVPRKLSNLDLKDANLSLRFFRDATKSSYARHDFHLPFILSSNYPVIKALINYKHLQLSHAVVHTLRPTERDKNIKAEDTLSEADIILVRDDHTNRINWNLGKILKLYPGKDEKVRVSQVKTKLGSCLHPVQKLYLLEVMEKTKSSVHPVHFQMLMKEVIYLLI
ncbi:integrase catalytic domain-containing protein [Trichonephila clavata]|uniref:Integrase catalytic domain-containing protein n=1 Tax=Trichonephila clavata TaxID=2740835 RepID=A0A8X6HDQ4_TRICU|nr:integrase catalytic domain-containing protein [Trichonephila clavata]